MGQMTVEQWYGTIKTGLTKNGNGTLHIQNANNYTGNTVINAGKVFVNFARNILQIEAEMTAHIHAYQTGHGGGIYLHCDPGLSGILHRQVTGSFSRLHPDVNLYIIESGRETAQEALLNASAA